jgi:hypothetical protein
VFLVLLVGVFVLYLCCAVSGWLFRDSFSEYVSHVCHIWKEADHFGMFRFGSFLFLFVQISCDGCIFCFSGLVGDYEKMYLV